MLYPFYLLGSLLFISIFVEVLLKISSSLYNASCPRLTISLVIASGPGDFFNFRFDSALASLITILIYLS